MFATKSSKPFSFFSINGPTKFFQDKKKTNKNYIRGKQSCIYKYFSIFVNLSSSNHEEKKLQQKNTERKRPVDTAILLSNVAVVHWQTRKRKQNRKGRYVSISK